MNNDSIASQSVPSENGGAQSIDTEEKKIRPLRKRAMERNPDFSPEDESEWDEKEDEVFNELEDYNNSYRDAEAELDGIISADDELASVLNDMIVNKTPFRVAIAKFYSQEDLIPVEGDEDFEAYQSAFNERVEKKSARDKRDAEIQENEKSSLDAIDSFAEEKGMDEEGKKSFIEFINGFFNNMLYKKLSPDMLVSFYNAMNHDADVASAAEAGEIKGRNARIEADIEDEEEKMSGDGIPTISKGDTISDEEPEKQNTMIDDILKNRRKF